MKKYLVRFDDIKPEPAEYEISAAEILAEYFSTNIRMVKRRVNAKTADLKIGNVFWELKSPVGDGKRTMQNNLRKADDQSPRIVIDLRRCKMHEARAASRLRYELTKANAVKRLLVITKKGMVLEIK